MNPLNTGVRLFNSLAYCIGRLLNGVYIVGNERWKQCGGAVFQVRFGHHIYAFKRGSMIKHRASTTIYLRVDVAWNNCTTYALVDCRRCVFLKVRKRCNVSYHTLFNA